MTDRWDDRSLERLMKQGLERRAREVDVDVPAAARAREAAGRSRWRTAAAAGLAAACVAGVAGGVVLLRDEDSPSGSISGDPTTDGPTPPATGEWRTEYWHDVQVDVPPDWGWGGAPFEPTWEDRANGLLACAAGPFLAPGSSDPDWQTTPYVGRPLFLTDVCMSYRDDQWPEPTAPYVWLGSPIEPGIREFDNGYVQETRGVNGSTVTVATAEPVLRARILDSVRAAETGQMSCEPELGAPPEEFVSVEGVVEPTAMTVCVYGRDRDGDPVRLRYGQPLEPEAAERLLGADWGREKVPGPEHQSCLNPEHEWVVLKIRGHDAVSLPEDDYVARFVVHFGDCAALHANGDWPLTEALVSPWAVGGVPAVVSGPSVEWEPWMADYFIGPQG